MQDPTKRFSDPVENYAKYRPGYPDDMLAYLGTLLRPGAIVADIGSGTGILTRRLLDHGYVVYAVEPNEPMQREAERALEAYPSFHSMNGRAEATGLDDHSIPDYKRLNHRRIRAEEIDGFFTPGDVRLVKFQNHQLLDRGGFHGRLLSSSYVPNVGQPGHEEIVEEADQIFLKHAADGKVRLEYQTTVYLGRWG